MSQSWLCRILDAAGREGVVYTTDKMATNSQTQTVRLVITPDSAQERERLMKSMAECKAALSKLVESTLFEHPEIALLFTTKGGLFMKKLTSKEGCGYLNWNWRNLSVRMYGSSDQVTRLTGKLQDYIQKQLKLPRLELHVARIFKAHVRRSLPKLKRVLAQSGGE